MSPGSGFNGPEPSGSLAILTSTTFGSSARNEISNPLPDASGDERSLMRRLLTDGGFDDVKSAQLLRDHPALFADPSARFGRRISSASTNLSTRASWAKIDSSGMDSSTTVSRP